MRTLEAVMQTLFGTVFASGFEMEIMIPIISVIMVFSIPIVAIITEYYQKKNKAQLMEKAIEKGVPVDKLRLDEPQRRMPYRSGMICVATGIGVSIFGLALGYGIGLTGDPDAAVAKAVMASGGAIVFLIGVALLINDKMNYKRFLDNGNGDR